MREVRIEKGKLREKVQANRDAHRDVFERAVEGYRTAAAVFFAEQLDRLREGRQFMLRFAEPVPEDHTADYDAILEMLDMGEEQHITLTAAEFRQYVRDDWGWKQEWTQTTQNYVS